ncbi:DNA topoisomerase IB [Phenylobacterium sp.]|uniref:DNA topoisomerase IB n=1 Tax=Phenylobacterium sp. TaxID=1871053 RepID=UPI00260B8253|nr:DNA topoisomerase IB [Phenylobacterium sp.]
MPRDVAHPPERLEFGLIYVNACDPGLARKAGPDGFRYVDAQGAPVTDKTTLARIEALVIPPAWTEVWICASPRGHIQAVGRDQRGRRQYRYHDRWRIARDLAKFERLTAFGRALPRLRRRVEADLGRRGLPREKVLAAVVRLLETTLIRVGNDEYARTNKSYGLTTLRDRHASITSRGAVFSFRGKSGKEHETGFQDRRLARVVKSCQDLPGQRLFQYVDGDGVRHAVESADVNAYLREATGLDISAKDFRTWAATVSAARALAGDASDSATAARRTVTVCVKAVAQLLGNTPAVCRKAYIHPLVLAAYEGGDLPLKPAATSRAFELSVIRFLERAAQKEPQDDAPEGRGGGENP